MKKIKINYKVIILFIIATIISQALIKVLSPSNFLKSPTYIFLPIVGFFGMYYFSAEIMKYVRINNKFTFAGFFIVIALLCFYIALFMFYWNALKVLNNQPIAFPYFKILLDSAFLEFIVSGVFGIFAIKK
ncbi:MAG: hypothetical protein WCY27_01195 [archaeon]|jgi:hypothetical protein|nr:hypothetical protein [archaeon]MDD2477789.1 hypothetical protein [Candidatus ainarchaeum sp.]MDD3084894.1 hypothetical protein [Candidatus ainarchaeum sp.]MDD4221173.1 hypothetical protein [Candidatus ainarchaeum sp.]MDD4662875.1 hypothetical protein [Candidatus ainarchaeum sp.]